MRTPRSHATTVRQKPSGGVSAHAPRVEEAHTVTVTCAISGPRVQRTDGLRPCATLADVEAFCARLRALGAKDSLPLPDIVALRAVLAAGAR